jgi:ABC-type branched-subunit amino acid transport system substrate-binding protein
MNFVGHGVIGAKRKVGVISSAAALLLTSVVALGVGATASGAAAKSPIKLMVIYTSGASITSNAETLAGAQVAALAINKAGGIQGHQIRIVGCNDQGNSNIDAACARTAVSDHVFAEVGRSGFGGNVIDPILTPHKIAMVGLHADFPIDYTANNSFPIEGGGVVEFMAQADELAHEGKTKISIAGITGTLTSQIITGVEAELSKGLLKTPSGQTASLAGTEQWEFTASDYTPQAEAIQTQGADGVLTYGNASGDVALQAAALQLGMSESAVPFTNPSSNFPNTLMKQVPNGFLSVDSLPPAQTSNLPGVKKFRQQMAAGTEVGIANAGAINEDEYSLNAWLSVYGVAAVAGKMKIALTAPNLLQTLRKTKTFSIAGVVNWDPGAIGTGPQPLPDWTNYNMYFDQVENGKLQLISPKPFNMEAIIKEAFAS